MTLLIYFFVIKIWCIVSYDPNSFYSLMIPGVFVWLLHVYFHDRTSELIKKIMKGEKDKCEKDSDNSKSSQ